MIFSILMVEAIQYICLKFLKANNIQFNELLFLVGRWDVNSLYIRRHILLPTILNSSTYTLFSFINNKEKSSQILCIIELYIYSIVYSFGHWGFIYMSMIYCMPILLSCPLQKSYLKISYIIGIVLTIIYALYQYFIFPSLYHFYIMSISLASNYVSFIIARSISKVYHEIIDMNNKLENDAYTDNLVGLRNKNCFLKDVETLKCKSIAFIDIDNFKHINDNHGHDMGDRFLIRLSKFLKKLPEDCVSYRFGGDEFVIFSQSNVGSLEQNLRLLKEAFFNSCERDYGFGTTLSIGIVDYDENSNDRIEDLVLKSDSLLYEAKKSKDSIVTK